MIEGIKKWELDYLVPMPKPPCGTKLYLNMAKGSLAIGQRLTNIELYSESGLEEVCESAVIRQFNVISPESGEQFDILVETT